jgi:hypothetical protein
MVGVDIEFFCGEVFGSGVRNVCEVVKSEQISTHEMRRRKSVHK